ncbi:immunoglobulin I-set domain protein [Cooperia oncophora]
MFHTIETHLSTCTLLVEPPQLYFEQPLQDVEVQYGESVTLFCSVFGAPQAAVKWFHRGHVVAAYSAPSVETAVHTTRIASGMIETKLFVPCVTRHTLGEYTCEAISPCGEVISSTAIVGLSNSLRGCELEDERCKLIGA